MGRASVISGYTVPTTFWWASSGSTVIGIPDGGISGAHISWYKGGQAMTYQVQYRERRRYSPSGYTAAGVAPANQWEEWGAWQDPNDDVDNDTASPVSATTSSRVVTYQGHSWAFGYDISAYDMYQVQLRVRVFDEPSVTASEWTYVTLSAVIRPHVAFTAQPNATGGYDVTAVLTNWQRGGNSATVSGSRYCMLNARDENLGPWWNNDPWWSGGTWPLASTGGAFSVPASAASYGRIYAETLQAVTADGGVAVLDSSNVYPFDCEADSRAGSAMHPASSVVYMVEVGEHEDPAGVDEPTVTATETEDGDLLVAVTGGDWDGCSAWYTWTDARGVVRHGQVAMAETSSGWQGLVVAPPFDVPIQIQASVTNSGAWMVRGTEAEVASHGVVELRSSVAGGRLRIRYNARQTIQRRFDAEVDVVKTAGAGRPKSRHGVGGLFGITVSGLCAIDGSTGGWLDEQPMSAFPALEANADWLLRIPGGERYAVALTSYTLDNADAPGFVEIGLELQVVADGLD